MSTLLENSPFYLKMGALRKNAVNDLAEFFNDLPTNPEYQDGLYRPRRFGAFTFVGGKVNKLPHRNFNQSSEFNKFQGDIERNYADITEACYSTQGFCDMLAHYYGQSDLPHDTEVEIHQLRIQAKPGETIQVAPEGVHQDGYNRIGMFMINYENLTGGELKVHPEKDSPAMFEYLLKNGEYIVLNDANFWHDANDITGTSTADLGYYDLFVVTGIKPG